MIDDYIQDLINEGNTKENKKRKYALLDRLRTDCDYFLNGHPYNNNLWAGNVPDHIENMKALHNSFPTKDKPQWLTYNQIETYGREMVACISK